MRHFSEQELTNAVLARLNECSDPRFKRVMSSLIRHLHDFVRDVELTEAEWMTAIQFLTRTGHKCDGMRQEFILLSDTLGVSMLVDAINHRKPDGAVESTVMGPFFWEGAPEFPLGANIAEDTPGEPAFYSGRVLDLAGRPIAGAKLDIWSGDGDGYYDMQLEGEKRMRARGSIKTGADGRYWFWSIKPSSYPVPVDGPVGGMLKAMGRHPMRPAHIHMIVSAPGHVSVTTHLFVEGDPYLDSDAVFGVKDSLIVPLTRHEPGIAPTGQPVSTPYYTCSYDFKLVTAKSDAARAAA
jgi:hydroxyquinol 1,2-dioxygenase